MKIASNTLYLTVLLFFSSSSFSNDKYPIEFADFFIEHEDVIQITVAGSKSYVSIPSLITYDSFRLSSNKKLSLRFREYLKKESLKSVEIEKIVSTLTAGVVANPGCNKSLDQCIPIDVENVAEYVFDFDHKVLKIFVSSEMLEKKAVTKKYHNNRNDHKATILSSSLSGYIGENNHGSLTLSNDFIAGLTYGHISTETQYSTSGSNFDVYEANYQLEIENIKGIIGYQKYRSPSLNSTDFLNNNLELSGYSVTLGSSDNLLVGKNNASKTLNFFSPTGGRLEIKQNERVLVSRNIESGQQSIGYDEFPTGIYNVTISVTQGNSVSVFEVRQVVNTSQFDLAVKDWDYQVQLGYLDTDVSKLNLGVDISGDPVKSVEFEESSRYFGRASSTYRIEENLMVGTGVTGNNDDIQLQVATKLAVGDWGYGEVTLSHLNSGGYSQYASLKVSPFFASYSQNDFDVEESNLAHLLYGKQSTTEWSLGVSGNILGGNAYLNYLSITGEDEFSDYQSESLSASWSKFAFGGTLSLSANYSLNDNYDNQWSAHLMWTVNFNDNTHGSFSTLVNDSGYSDTKSVLTYSKQLDEASVSSSAGVTLGGDGVESELSLNVNGTSSYARYGAYGYLTDSGEYSLSGNFSTTQVLSKKGIMSTPNKGKSFIGIAPEWSENKEDTTDSELTYYISSDNGFQRKSDVSTKMKELIRLPEYTETELELDGDLTNVEIDKGSIAGFSLPGTLFVLDSKLTALESQMFVVSDVNGQPLDQLRCFGPGCKDVERLTDDGVFRVNYRDRMPFALVSNKKMCVFDIGAIGSRYIHAYCLPGLENPYAMDSAEDNSKSRSVGDLRLMGRYEFNAESAKLIERLEDISINPRVIKVGRARYIYIPSYTKYTVEQQMLLDSLEVYAMHDDTKNDKSFSVR